MSTIKIQLPDGSIKEHPQGVSAYDVAHAISPRLADAALVAKVAPIDADGEGELVDLARPIAADSKLKLLTNKDPEALPVFRHSSAHLLAAAVLELFPETKLGHGPVTESGFFYDFLRETPFTQDDLARIEKKMHEIVQRNEPFACEFTPRAEALAHFKAEGDFMKCHFIENLAANDATITLYKTGKFVDFCRGPHIPSTGKIKAFKLTTLAGAYWLGDEKNPQLQRIHGTSFYTQKELDEYLAKIEEAKRRDHRTLGKQLDLFSIQDLAGSGLIFWHPKGGIIRKTMEDWMREECLRRGYSLVFTPHVAKVNLWQTSGHEGFYADNMFTPMELDDGMYRLKPMNCPFHILIYKNTPKSYRDLPVRLAELGNVYRYERSGTMHGLLRVRGFTQDDAHIFCTPDQVESEVEGCIDFAKSVLNTFGFKQFKVELSIWDKNDRAHYAGKDEDWEHAEGALRHVLDSRGIPYEVFPGEAAFYGPKIDIKLVDALDRLWQLSTVQFDFNLPARFELEFVGEDGQKHQPVMVHRALFGSVERFFGVLIEHYAGAFPLWLAPVQTVVVPIAERHHEYARKVEEQLKAAGIRAEADVRNEKMNAKIREHALQKTPFILVVGDKEAESGEVNVRVRGKEHAEGSVKVEDFIARCQRLVAEHSLGLV
jgi:threonyl-tRNA synthetase